MEMRPNILKNKPLLVVFALWMLCGALIVYGGQSWLLPVMYVLLPAFMYLFYKSWRAGIRHITQGLNREN